MELFCINLKKFFPVFVQYYLRKKIKEHINIVENRLEKIPNLIKENNQIIVNV